MEASERSTPEAPPMRPITPPEGPPPSVDNAEAGGSAQNGEPTEPRHPGVLILRVPSQGNPGKEDIQIIPINGMDALAVPTVLRLAIKLHARTFDIE